MGRVFDLVCAVLVGVALANCASADLRQELLQNERDGIEIREPVLSRIKHGLKALNLRARQRRLAEARRLREEHEENLRKLIENGHKYAHDGMEAAIRREFLLRLDALKDQPEEKLPGMVFDILLESQFKSRPLVAGLRANDLLALLAVGRHDCTRERIQLRREVCARLAEHPVLSAFCTEANKLSENWCETPVSIVSPFADIADHVDSSEQVDSPEVTKHKLESLGSEVNPSRLTHKSLHPWQQAANFDQVYDILKRASKEGRLHVEKSDTLDLVSIDESKCTGKELEARGAKCFFYLNLELANFCREAFERSKEWCAKSGFVEHILGDAFHEGYIKLEVATGRTGPKLHALFGRVNPKGLERAQLLDWQNRAIYESVRQLLERSDDKTDEIFSNLNGRDMLALTKIEAGQCKGEELRRRRDVCDTMSFRTMKNFCLEAHQNSVDFCKSHNLV